MRQRHMPLGYRMAGGKIFIVPEQAELVKGVFLAYSEGNSMYQLARRLTEQGALNANHKPVWNHGTVGKILENRRYLGDEFYPAIIEPELFTKVQERRKEKSRELGRIMQPNSFGKRSMFADRLVCGVCGQPYRRYVEHCGQPGEKIVWKCVPGRQPDHTCIYGTFKTAKERPAAAGSGSGRAGSALQPGGGGIDQEAADIGGRTRVSGPGDGAGDL